MAKSTFTLEWQAREYEHKERSQDWFWAAGIITAGLALVAFIFGNIIFGILILLSAFSLALFINRPPTDLHIAVTELGVTRGKLFYPVETLASFWIDTDHPHKKVILRSKKLLMPLVVVPLGEDVDPERLHSLFMKILPEEYHPLPLPEKVLEYLGF
ncbi:hypothetical protein KW800_00825 [Candidatus Parcubacteria bacterium]|nr:hypothetical protein [Candidatus Parcubacteria bacterium]